MTTTGTITSVEHRTREGRWQLALRNGKHWSLRLSYEEWQRLVAVTGADPIGAELGLDGRHLSVRPKGGRTYRDLGVINA